MGQLNSSNTGCTVSLFSLNLAPSADSVDEFITFVIKNFAFKILVSIWTCKKCEKTLLHSGKKQLLITDATLRGRGWGGVGGGGVLHTLDFVPHFIEQFYDEFEY